MDQGVMSPLHINIRTQKAEMPALIVLCVLIFVGWGFHYGMLGWKGGLVWLLLSIPSLMFLIKKRRGEYFVKVDEEGISFRLHFFSSYMMIPWKYLQRIDYLEYEINFMLKETAQVVSLATSGLDDEDVDSLKAYISEAIAKREVQ
ncbi:hypothetical protein LBMAG26_13560 [Bacteroidota bacterium]|jgi:hypothetical protein|nr:hypothetical protein LBMAG26_13560 [Bacteroidota bacterium]